MSFNIIPTHAFERELKRLAKKHLSLKKDFAELLFSLKDHPDTGKPIGNSCFKIRMAISSKNKGKSGGARIITFVKVIDKMVYLISIYDKSESETITDKELLNRIENL